jgi:hypothetical protein
MKGPTPSSSGEGIQNISFNAATNTWYFLGDIGTNCMFYSTVTPPVPATWIGVPRSASTFTTQAYGAVAVTTSAFTSPINVARLDNKVTFPVNRMIAVGGGGGGVGGTDVLARSALTPAPNGGGTISYSDDDGATWTMVPGGATNAMFSSAADITANASFGVGGSRGANAVAWNGEKWVAAGNGRTNSLAFSDDGGMTWNGITGKSIFSVEARDVAWNGRMWVAVGRGINFSTAYSYDGVTWMGPVTDDVSGIPMNVFSYDIAGPTVTASMSDISGGGNHVIWTGKMWVATGTRTLIAGSSPAAYYTVAYSMDGKSWTGVPESGATSTGFDMYAHGIAWNGRNFVATGRGTVNTLVTFTDVIASATTSAFSTDATATASWQGLGNSVFSVWGRGITWGARRWMATGRGTNTVAYSTNGRNWQGCGANVFKPLRRFMAMGDTGLYTTVSNGQPQRGVAFSYSDDGVTWDAPVVNQGVEFSTPLGGTSDATRSAVFTNNILLTNAITDIASAHTGLMFSADGGASWARVPGSSDTEANGGTGMTAANGGSYSLAMNTARTRFLVGGGDAASATRKVYFSNDGFNWRNGVSSPNTSQMAWVHSSLWVGGGYNRWLVGGSDASSNSNGRIMYSGDADAIAAWIPASPATYTATVVCCFAANTDFSVILAGALSGNVIYRSVNGGANWTTVSISGTPTGGVRSIAFSPALGRWVAVGGGGGAANTIIYSTDATGTSWLAPPLQAKTAATAIFKNGSEVTRVIWDALGGRFLVGGWNGAASTAALTNVFGLDATLNNNPGYTMAYSADGVNWTPVTVRSSDDTGASGGTVFGPFLTRCREIMALDISGDFTPINTGYSVTWNSYANRFVATGNGTSPVVYSNDGGVTWTPANQQPPQQAIVVAGGASAAANTTSVSPITYTIDGKIWSQAIGAKEAFGSAGTVMAVKYGQTSTAISPNGRIWVAGGTGTSSIAFSQNGIRWTPVANATTMITNVRAIAYAAPAAEQTSTTTTTTTVSGVGNGVWVAGGDTTNSLVFSYDGISWSEVPNSLTILNRCNAIAYGATGTGTGLFVAGGLAGTIDPTANMAYSTDGYNWQPIRGSGARISSSGASINCITYGRDENGRGLWVAGAFGSSTVSILYSYNGIDWVGVVDSGGSLSSTVTGLAYGINSTTGRGLWVASVYRQISGQTPSGYSFLFSANGRDGWTPVSNTKTGLFEVNISSGATSVAYLNGVWYATGLSAGISTGRTLAYSYEGSSGWFGVYPTTNLYGVAVTTYSATSMLCVATTGEFMIPAGAGAALTPIRGLGWTAGVGSAYLQHPTLVFGASGAQQAAAATAAMSTDGGRSWGASTLSIATSAFRGGVCNDAFWNGIVWAAVGYDAVSGAKVATSKDGVTWTQIPTGSVPIAGVLHSIMWNGSVWMAGGDGSPTNDLNTNSIAWSPDLAAWTGISNTDTKLRVVKRIAWNGMYWVAVGSGDVSTIMHSRDKLGLVWEDTYMSGAIGKTAVAMSAGNDVVWGGGRWVAVGRPNNGGGNNAASIIYSVDTDAEYAINGRRWTAVAGSAQLFPYGANSVSWNGKRFIATGPASCAASTGNIIAWSADGIAWTAYSSAKTVAPGQRWVAVGSGSRACIALSADGQVWTDVSGSAVLFPDISGASSALVSTMKTGGRAIGWNGSSLVAVGARAATTVTASTTTSAATMATTGRTTIPVCAFIGSGNGVMGGGTTNAPMDATAAGILRTSSSVFITHMDVNMRESSAPWANMWLNTYTDLSGTQLFQVTPETQTFSSALKWNGWSWVANFGMTTFHPQTGEQYGSIWYCSDPLARVGWSVASNSIAPRILIGQGGYAALEWNGVAWLACGYDPNNNNMIYTTDKYGATGWTAVSGTVSGAGSASFQPVCIASSSRFWVVGGSQGAGASAIYYTSDRTGATGWRAVTTTGVGASVLPAIRITSMGYNGSTWICCGGGRVGTDISGGSISWRADPTEAEDFATGWTAATVSGTSGGIPPIMSASSAIATNAGAGVTAPIWVVVGEDLSGNGGGQIAYTTDITGSSGWKKPATGTLPFTTFGRLNGIAWTGYSWIATSGAGFSRLASTTDPTAATGWNNTTNGLFTPTLSTNAVAFVNIPISLLTTGMPSSAGAGAGTGAMWRAGAGRAQGLLPSGGTETTSVVVRSSNGAEGTSWSQVYSRNFLIAVGGGVIRDASGGGGTNRMAYSYDGGLSWTTNNTSVLTNAATNTIGSIRTVKYGNGMWVAGGDVVGSSGSGNNCLAWSRDGVNWTGAGGTQIFGSAGACYAVCCNDRGRWVAVGGAPLGTVGTYTNTSGSIYTMAWSDDGMNWTPILGSRALFGIVCQGVSYGADASGVGMWTAIGRGAAYTGCAYSYDGKTWYLSQTSGSLFGTGVNVLTERYAPVGVSSWRSVSLSSTGQYQTAVVYGGQIYTSSDYGVNWTARDSNRNWNSVSISSTGQYQTAVVYSGSDNKIYTSSDYGINWTARDSGRNWISVSLSSTGQYQTAVVNGGQIYTSSDYGVNWTARDSGRNWNSVSISSTGQYQTAVVYSSSTEFDNKIYTSSDYGINWTARDSRRYWISVSLSSTGQYQTAVVYTGSDNKIYTSSDYGINWTARESGRDWRSVSLSSTGQYQTAVFYGGQIYTSSDYGVNWTARDSGRDWFSVSLSSTGQYQTAVVYTGSGNKIYISSNFGETWSAAATDSRSLGITYGKDASGAGMWVATAGRRDRDVSANVANTMAYSYDGKLWRGIRATAGLSEQAWSVAYGKDGFGVGMWVAAGYDTHCGLKWSYDGVTWNASMGASGAAVWAGMAAGRRALSVYWNGSMWLASTSDTRNGEPRGTSMAANNASSVPGYLLYSYNGKNWLPVLAPNTYAAAITGSAQPSVYSVLPNPAILDFGSFYDDQAQRGVTIANTTARTVGAVMSGVPIENVNTIVPYGRGSLTTGQVPFLMGGDSGLVDTVIAGSSVTSGLPITSELAAATTSLSTSTDGGITWRAVPNSTRVMTKVNKILCDETTQQIVAVGTGNYSVATSTPATAGSADGWVGVFGSRMTDTRAGLFEKYGTGASWFGGAKMWIASGRAQSRRGSSLAVSVNGTVWQDAKIVSQMAAGSAGGARGGGLTSRTTGGAMMMTSALIPYTASATPLLTYTDSAAAFSTQVSSVATNSQYNRAVVGGSGVQFVAGGRGGIAVSNDGQNWTAAAASGAATVFQTPTNVAAYSTAAGSGGFDASFGTVALTQRLTTPATYPSGGFYSVSVSKTAQYQTAVVSGGNIWTSFDFGVTWTERTTGATREWWFVSLSSSGQYQSAVVYNNTSGNIWTSSDYGVTWTARTTPGNKYWNSVSLSTTGQYQTVTSATSTGNIWSSSDFGVNWSTRTTAGSRDWIWVSLSSTGQHQTAVVNSSGNIWISSDFGVSWSERTTGATRNWRSVSLSSTGQYQTAVASSSNIWTSSDYGIIWTERTTGSNRSWNSVSLSSTGQYQTAVVNSGNIWTSTDYGVTWTERTTGATRTWYSVSLSSTGQYQTAVVYNNQIWTSTDFGVTWVQRSTATRTNAFTRIKSSASGQYQLATSGPVGNTNGQLYVSSDYGQSWIPRRGLASWLGGAVSATGGVMMTMTPAPPTIIKLNNALSYSPILYLDATNSNSYNVSTNTWTNLGSLGGNVVMTNMGSFDAADNGGSFNFNGSSNYGTLSVASTSLTQLTYVGVVKRSSSSSTGHIIDFGIVNPAFYIVSSNSALGFYSTTPTYPLNSATNGTIPALNVWYHLAVTVTSTGSATFYINGVSSGTATGTASTWTQSSFAIGARGDGIEKLNGKISSLAAYNRVLTASEIYNLYITSNILRSTDYGNTFTEIPGTTLTGTTYWRAIAITNSAAVQTALAHGSSIYRSADYGSTWNSTAAVDVVGILTTEFSSVASPTYAWKSIAMSSDAKYQTGVLGGTSITGQIYVNSNYGREAWTAVDSARNWAFVAMSADGRYQSAVVTSGAIYYNSTFGTGTWTAVTSPTGLTWTGIAVSSADGKYQTAVASGPENIRVNSNFGVGTWVSKEVARNWSGIAVSSTGRYQTAIHSGGFIYIDASFGEAATWTPVLTDTPRAWASVAMSSTGQYQTAVVAGGKIYVNNNYGASGEWVETESNRAWISVAVSGATGRYQTAVAQNAQIYTNANFGLGTWTAVDSSLNWVSVTVSSDGKYQSAAVATSGKVYFSRDFGSTWSTTAGVDIMGNRWQDVALSAETGAVQVTCVSGGYLYVSSDTGANWVSTTVNIDGVVPQATNRVWQAVAVSANGEYGLACVNSTSASGYLYRSTDSGASWSSSNVIIDGAGTQATNRPWQDVGMSANGKYQVACLNTNTQTSQTTNIASTVSVMVTPPGALATTFGAGWTQRGQDIDGEAVGDQSGYSVSLSADGTVVAVGAPMNFGANGRESGQVRVYDLSNGTTWRQRGEDIDGAAGLSSLPMVVTATGTSGSANWYSVSLSSTGQYQTAVVNSGGQIYTSSDYGVNWTARDSGRNWYSVSLSSTGQYQTAVVYSGSDNKIFTSSDYGMNWTARDSNRNWRSVSLSSTGQYQTAVVYGVQIHTSSDYGVNWTAREGARDWRSVSISSTGQYQTAVVQGAGQIYTSSDYGVNWTARDSTRNWFSVSLSSTGQYQTAVVNGVQIHTSSDYGVNWTAREGARNWLSVSLSSTGQYQTAVVYSSGQIYTSSDYGVNWTARDSNRNWQSVSISSTGQYQTAVVYGVQIYFSRNYGVTWSEYASYEITEGDRFGTAVSLSANGNTVAVGSPYYDLSGIINRGQVRVFDWSGIAWTVRGTNILLGEGSNDYSGMSVSLSEDGKVVAIGAPLNDGSGNLTDSGHARVYAWDGSAWAQRGADIDGGYGLTATNRVVTATGTSGSRRWYSVAVSETGQYQSTVVLGGQIYISSNYGVNLNAVDISRNWSKISMSSNGQYQTATIETSEQIYISSNFGMTWTAKDNLRIWTGVSLSSTGQYQTALVYGGQIYISSNYGNNWSAMDSSRNWTKVSMSSNGQYQTAIVWGGGIYRSTNYGANWVLVPSANGPPTDVQWGGIAVSSSGQYQSACGVNEYIYVSTNFGVNWTSITNGVSIGLWFHISVSSSGQYQTANISSGRIYISSNFGVSWTITTTTSVRETAMSSTGQYQTAAISNGLIYFSRDYGVNWSTTASYEITEGDQAGTSVSLSADGSVVAVGGPYADTTTGIDSGQMRVFSWTGSIWSPRGDPIIGESTGDRSGWSASMSADGTTVAIGAPYNNGVNGIGSGQVRVYKWNGSTWGTVGTVNIEGDIDGEAGVLTPPRVVTATATSPTGNWYSVSISSTGQYQSAVIYGATGNIYTSYDYGVTWRPITNGAPTDYWNHISISSSGQYQTAETRHGSNNSHNIYVSSDFGISWSLKKSITLAYSSSISVSSSGRYQSFVAESEYIYNSANYGVTWNPVDAVRSWNGISVSSTGQFQSAIVNGGYIYTSSDFGIAWTSKKTDTTRIWRSISVSSTGQYQSAVESGGNIYTSSDFGVNWTPKDSVRTWRFISLSSTGQYQSVTVDSSSVYTSSDFGNTWTLRTTGLPSGNWYSISVSSTGQYQSATFDGAGGLIYFSRDYGATWSSTASYEVVTGGDQSGYSLSLSATGNSLAVGAPYNDAGATGADRGHVRVYDYNPSTNLWPQRGADNDGEASDDLAGWSVSLSADGSTVAFGAPMNDGSGNLLLNSGSVRVFTVPVTNPITYTSSSSSIADICGNLLLIKGAAGTTNIVATQGATTTNGVLTVSGTTYTLVYTLGSASPISFIYYSKNYGASWTSLTAAGSRSWSSVALSENGGTISATTNDATGGVWVYSMPDDQYYRAGAVANAGGGAPTTTPATVRAIAYGNSGVGAAVDGYWVAGADASANSLAYSSNGVDWTAVAGSKTTLFNTVNGVAYGADTAGTPLWVAVGLPFVGSLPGSTAYSIAYSYNMTQWTGVRNAANFTGQGNHVAYGQDEFGAGMWVAVGQGDGVLAANLGDSALYNSNGTAGTTIFYSYDGANWAAATGLGIFAISGTDVAWGVDASGVGTWVATGIGYTDPLTGVVVPGGQVAHSTNGRVWTPIRAPVPITPAMTPVTLSALSRVSVLPLPPASSGFTASIIGSAWSQMGLDISGTQASEESGYSVSLSADGTTVAIGAYAYDNAGTNEGRVRIYKYNGTSWDLLGSEILGTQASEYSGVSVSLSADGTTVAIGSHAYDKAGGTTNANTNEGRVRIYKYNKNGTSDWDLLGAEILGTQASENSGYGVSLSADGTTVAIGAYAYDNAGTNEGRVRIYKYNKNGTSSWDLLGAEILGTQVVEYSGISVSLSADGTTVAIGSYIYDKAGGTTNDNTDEGRVRIYKYNKNGTSAWDLLGAEILGTQVGEYSGRSVSLSADGTTVAIGAYAYDKAGGTTNANTDEGRVRIYKYNKNGTSSWDLLGAEILGTQVVEYSGISVSLSADGTTVAIGSYIYDKAGGTTNDNTDEGRVRIYKYNKNGTSDWDLLVAEILGTQVAEQSGNSVSLSADGTTVAIGAPYYDKVGGTTNANTQEGRTRVYKLAVTGASFSTSNPAVAEINNGVLLIKDISAGSTTITAFQPATPPFTSAPVTVQGTLDVSGTTYTLTYHTFYPIFTPFPGAFAGDTPCVAYGRAGSQGTGAPRWIVGGAGGTNVFAMSSAPTTFGAWSVVESFAPTVNAPFPTCSSIGYSNGVWVAANNTDDTNILARSTDGGSTWASVAASSVSGILTGAAALGANSFCNYSLAYADYSNDTNLRSWIAVQGTKNFFFEGGVNAVATVTPDVSAAVYNAVGGRAWWVAGGVGLAGVASIGSTTDPSGATGWTKATSPAIANLAGINAVAFSPFTQRWLAVGAGATGSLGTNVLTSDDSTGATWTAGAVTSAITPVITLNTCVWNQAPASASAAGRWLAGGTRDGGVGADSASLYISTDASGAATPWTPVTGTGAILSQVYSLAFNGQVWIAAGAPATDNGSTSTLMRTTTDPTGATGWQGIPVTNISTSGFDTAARSVTWNADQQMWVATGENTGSAADASFSSVIYSRDVNGAPGTWRTVRESNSVCFSGEGTGVAFTGDKWFAVGDNGSGSGGSGSVIVATTGSAAATAADASWNPVTHGTALTRASDIAYTGRRLVASGASASGATSGIIYSADGTGSNGTWTSVPNVSAGAFNDASGGASSITFEASYEGTGRLVATGRSATNALSVSTDGGVSWTAPSVQYSSSNTFDTTTTPLFTTGGNSVAYVGNDTLFAGGGNDVHWNGKRWVATGRNSVAAASITVTPATTSGTAPLDVVNNNTAPVATSEDGITWQSVRASQAPTPLTEGTFIGTNSRIGATPLINSQIVITDGGDTESVADYGGGSGTGVAQIDIIAELTPVSNAAASVVGTVGILGAAGNGGVNGVGHVTTPSFDNTAFTITTRPM